MNGKSSVKVSRRGRHGRLLEQTQLVQTVQELAAEVETLRSRLAQIEHNSQEKSYRVPQSLTELRPRRLPPPGQMAMQAIMGKLEVDEPVEDLLAQLKALETPVKALF